MSKLASVSSDLKIWDFNGREISLVSTSSTSNSTNFLLSCCVWSHTNQVVAVSGTGDKIHLVQSSTGEILSSLPIRIQDQYTGIVRSLSFSDNSRYLASTSSRNILVWDLKKRELKSKLEGCNSIVHKALFLRDGRVISGDESGAIRIWDIRQNISSPELADDDATPINALKISYSDQHKVATGCESGALKLWDIESLKNIRSQSIHQKGLSTLSFSPKNDRLIATGGKDKKVYLIDTEAPHNSSVTACISLSETVTSISFHESSIQTAVSTVGGTILVYDWRSIRRPLCQISGSSQPINEITFQVFAPLMILLVYTNNLHLYHLRIHQIPLSARPALLFLYHLKTSLLPIQNPSNQKQEKMSYRSRLPPLIPTM